MDFSKYAEEYRRVAQELKRSDKFIDEQLNNAKKLHDRNLPIIYTPKHFSELVGVKLEYLYGVSNSPKKYYRNFEIRKKSGKIRKLSEPLPILKEIQSWIYDNILCNIKTSQNSKAYKKNQGIKANARFHKNQKVLITMDIKEYFPSITNDKVFMVFKRAGYSNSLSALLANICCLDECIPQGAPTSPMLSNIVTINLDKRLSGYCKNNDLRYTRYADDIAISGDIDDVKNTIMSVKKIVEDEGYDINKDKTKVRRYYQRQEVTGIIVNSKFQKNRSYRKEIRKEVYYMKKFGITEHFKRINEQAKYKSEVDYLRNLIGRITHTLYINASDSEMIEYKKISINMLKEKLRLL